MMVSNNINELNRKVQLFMGVGAGARADNQVCGDGYYYDALCREYGKYIVDITIDKVRAEFKEKY